MTTVAQQRRADALKQYYENPNTCEECSKVVKIPDKKKVQSARRKRFCSVACWKRNLRGKNKNVSRVCSTCGRKYVWKRNKGHTLERCNSCIQMERRHRRKIEAVRYLGGKCQLCGYSRCLSALDFHHRESSKKEFHLSTRGLTLSWERLKAELDKCDLLCARCHREEHAKDEDFEWDGGTARLARLSDTEEVGGSNPPRPTRSP